MKWQFKIVPTKSLKPLEYVFPHHLKNLYEMIHKDNMIKYPLIVDDKHHIVLDGSHRYVFLMQEGLKMSPVIELDYSSSHVRVGLHMAERIVVKGPVGITKEEVIKRGLSGDLFPPRTTRHFIPFIRPEINISLDTLGEMKKVDMDWIIAKVDIQQEINHNKKYVKEINEEILYMKNYIHEFTRTKVYLKEQIKRMKNEK